MRITGPALNVSFLLISGSASMALLGCASTSSEAPQDAEVSTTSEGRRATIDPSTFVWVVVGDASVVRPQLEALGLPVEVRPAQ